MEEQVSLQGEAPAQPADVEPVVAAQPEEASPPPDTEAQAEPQKKADQPPVQKRIDQLTWKAHEAERRLNAELVRRAEAEQRAQQYEQQLQELMRRATMPTMDQVGLDPDAYAKAVQTHYENWNSYQQQQAQKAMEERRRAEEHARRQQTIATRVAEGQQKYTDWDEVVNNPMLPPLPQVNPAVVEAILEHEQMPEITYFLGKNPAEAHRIAQMPPARAILEVGKIAAKLSLQPAQPSKAPPPPGQVSGGNATVQKDPSQMSYDEFVAFRRKQIAARR
jgi:hypothetical protein